MSSTPQESSPEITEKSPQSIQKEEMSAMDQVFSTRPITPSEPESPEIQETNETMSDIIKFFKEITILIIIILLIRSFLITPFRISGQSMEPNYHNGEYILVDKWSYLNFATHFDGLRDTTQSGGFVNGVINILEKIPIHIGDPKRGDAVVIRPHVDKSREYYLKRILGLPGDTIRIADGVVSIKTPGSEDFIELNESYLGEFEGKTHLPPTVRETEFIIPEDSYWVMGDNRQNSADSRSCFINNCLGHNSTHFIKREDVVGKVFLDFGYFNIFQENAFPKLGELRWIYPPRFFSTTRSVEYPELSN